MMKDCVVHEHKMKQVAHLDFPVIISVVSLCFVWLLQPILAPVKDFLAQKQAKTNCTKPLPIPPLGNPQRLWIYSKAKFDLGLESTECTETVICSDCYKSYHQ